MSSTDGFGLRVSKGVIAKVVVAAVGLVGSVFFARELGPVGYGLFHTFVAAADVLDNPVTGFGVACKKRVSEPEFDAGEVLGAGLLIGTVGSLVVSGAVILVEPSVDYFALRGAGWLLAAVLTGSVLFKMAQHVLAGTGQFGNAVGVDAVRSLGTIPLQAVFVLAGLGVTGMVYGLTLASVATVPLVLYVLRVRPRVPSRETLRSLWTYARYSVPNNFVGATASRIDILLLTGLLGSAAAGDYRVALQLVLPGTMLSAVMSSGLFAEVSRLASRESAVDTEVTNNVAFASIVAIPLFFGALAMPESLVVTVFGGAYAGAGVLLVGLAVYQVLKTQTTQLASVVSGQDRPDVRLAIDATGLLINLVVGVTLAVTVGAIGVVIATVLVETLKYVLYTYFARQLTRYDMFPRPLVHQLSAGAVMFVVLDPVHGFVGVRSWVDLAGLIGLGGILYGLTLVLASDVFLATVRGILADARDRYG
ncbi:MAG: lipopolysaccharide biosynthesis protein [Halobaculum sp.]